MEATRTQPCRVCREPMTAGAKKCIHCDSYQNWQRHVGVGTTTLALLVALISVTGSTVPAILDATSPDVERVQVNLLDPNPEALTVSVVNAGSEYGIVRRTGRLEVSYAERPPLKLYVYLNPVMERDLSEFIIEPGEVKAYWVQFKFAESLEATGAVDPAWVPLGCELEYVVAHLAESRKAKLAFDCSEGLPLPASATPPPLLGGPLEPPPDA
jgi:hypothetical protein